MDKCLDNDGEEGKENGHHADAQVAHRVIAEVKHPEIRKTDYETCIAICPRSHYPFYIVSNYIKWVKTSRKYSMYTKRI